MIGAYIFRIHDLMVKADNSQPRGGFEFQRRILHYAKVPNIECQAGQIKMLQYRFHQAKLVVNVLFFSIFLFFIFNNSSFRCGRSSSADPANSRS